MNDRMTLPAAPPPPAAPPAGPPPAGPSRPLVSLAALIAPEHVFFRLAAADKTVLLAELARRATAPGRDAREIAGLLTAREALGSTGVGAGIALPHARLPGLTAPMGFLARLERPIDFAAVDGVRVDLVFLLLSPQGSDGLHLASLAAATRRLRRPAVTAAIRAADTPATMRAALVDETIG